MTVFSAASPLSSPAKTISFARPEESVVERRWYAVFTIPQNEKSAVRHLGLRQIEAFLPTYDSVRVWKNRQKVKITLPLFPSYLFVRIGRNERSRVLQSPGVLHIVGNSHEPIPLSDDEIDFLRSDFCRQKIEPYKDLVVGQKVRVRAGLMRGVEGVLIRKNNSLRFVMTLGLINQHAAVEVCAKDLEPLCA